MKNLLLLLLLLPALAAAKVPDEEDIQNKTMDAESPFYYPSLMMRYNAGFDSRGNPTFFFDRERLVRRAARPGWHGATNRWTRIPIWTSCC